jgi:acetyl esterase/lipase
MKRDFSTQFDRQTTALVALSVLGVMLAQHTVVAQASTAVPPQALNGSQPLVLKLWPAKVPDPSGIKGPERVRMSPKLDRKQVEVTESTRLITDVTEPSVTVYRPAAGQATSTAMLICPGGGYWDLYWQLEGEEVAAWLNSIGITGIILKYRVPRGADEPKTEPARRPLQDAQRAISLVRSKVADWGLSSNRIGIVGFSAGGHLALATATSFEKRAYPPTDDIDQISCRPDFAVALYSGYLKPKDKDELTPSMKVPAGTPPVFLAHGGDDLISSPEGSVYMYLALKHQSVPAELHIYAATAHDFGVRTNERPCSTWTASCANWLKHLNLLGPENR